MANSTGHAGGSKASRSAPIGIAGGHSFRQFGQDGGGGPRRAVAVARLVLNFSTGQGRRGPRGHCHWRSCSPACLAGSGAGVSAAADWRKDAVQSDVALVMRGLLQTHVCLLRRAAKHAPGRGRARQAADRGRARIASLWPPTRQTCCGQCRKSRLSGPCSAD